MRESLYKARRDAGLTQVQIAVLAGVDRTVYNRIERGSRCPDVNVALRVASALNKTVEHIFLPDDVLNKHQEEPSKPSGTLEKAG